MKQLMVVKCGGYETSLNQWPAMPKTDKTPEDYSLVVDGKPVTRKDGAVMVTGGGTFPVYTYIKMGDEVRWFAGRFTAGTEVTTELPAPTSVVKAVGEVAVVGEVAPVITVEVAAEPAAVVEPVITIVKKRGKK
jgi:hypothetical protein